MTITRRTVLASAGAAAAAAALPPAPALAAQPPPLPAELSPGVFRERQEKLRAGARARGLDVLFVMPSTNLAYAANLAIGRSERLTALLLFADGPAVLVTPSFEESNHKRSAVLDDVKTWPEDGDPIGLVAKLLNGKKTIGVEGATTFGTVTLLGTATGAKLEDATPVFDALRTVKTDEEQALIREAGKRTNAAIAATHSRLKSGLSEMEVSRMLEEEFRKQGVSGGVPPSPTEARRTVSSRRATPC
jgi:Xaa-Pro dipeptidase